MSKHGQWFYEICNHIAEEYNPVIAIAEIFKIPDNKELLTDEAPENTG